MFWLPLFSHTFLCFLTHPPPTLNWPTHNANSFSRFLCCVYFVNQSTGVSQRTLIRTVWSLMCCENENFKAHLCVDFYSRIWKVKSNLSSKNQSGPVHFDIILLRTILFFYIAVCTCFCTCVFLYISVLNGYKVLSKLIKSVYYNIQTELWENSSCNCLQIK